MRPHLWRWMLMLCFGLAGCRDRIQHGLDERQANELLAVLTERGFDATKVGEQGKKPTWAIEVDTDQSIDAVRVLAELGLPRPKAPTTIEVLGNGGLVPTAAEDRARQLVGLSGDIAATLETVDGVTSARVHLVIPVPPRPGQAPLPSKASAYLRVRPGALDRVTPLRDELKALVAASVDGLSPDAVTLVINEVATTVTPPREGLSNESRLRALVVAMAIAVSGLACIMVFLSVRLRQFRRRSAQLPSAPSLAKPVVVTAARKVS